MKPDAPARYVIRVAGALDSRWAAWFHGLEVHVDGPETIISGSVADQAALHGVLQRVRDIGIPLISLTQLPSDSRTEPTALRYHEGN